LDWILQTDFAKKKKVHCKSQRWPTHNAIHIKRALTYEKLSRRFGAKKGFIKSEDITKCPEATFLHMYLGCQAKQKNRFD
jgi:hypothetical protein